MRTAIGALSAALLLSLTACGNNAADSYKKTDPTTIAADAHAALRATTALHVSGTIQLGNESATVDLTSDATGAATGTISLQGAVVQVAVTGGKSGKVYVKAGQGFWSRIAPQYASRLAGSWVLNVVPLSSVIRQLTLPRLIATEAAYAWEKESPQLVGTGNVNGTATAQIAVLDSQSGAKETLDVAAASPHHLLRESEPSAFTLSFDQFGTSVNVPTPAASEVVDLPKVLAGRH